MDPGWTRTSQSTHIIGTRKQKQTKDESKSYLCFPFSGWACTFCHIPTPLLATSFLDFLLQTFCAQGPQGTQTSVSSGRNSSLLMSTRHLVLLLRVLQVGSLNRMSIDYFFLKWKIIHFSVHIQTSSSGRGEPVSSISNMLGPLHHVMGFIHTKRFTSGPRHTSCFCASNEETRQAVQGTEYLGSSSPRLRSNQFVVSWISAAGSMVDHVAPRFMQRR